MFVFLDESAAVKIKMSALALCACEGELIYTSHLPNQILISPVTLYGCCVLSLLGAQTRRVHLTCFCSYTEWHKINQLRHLFFVMLCVFFCTLAFGGAPVAIKSTTRVDVHV